MRRSAPAAAAALLAVWPLRCLCSVSVSTLEACAAGAGTGGGACAAAGDGASARLPTNATLRAVLARDGHVLVRGAGLRTALDFQEAVRGVFGSFMAYEGGTNARKSMEADVLCASCTEPPNVTLQFHNEMAYERRFPSLLAFGCLTPADPGDGGETLLADNRAVAAAMEPGLLAKLRDLGLAHLFRYRDGDRPAADGGALKSWQDAYLTQDREAVRRRCRDSGMECRWREEDGALESSYKLPSFVRHPGTGEELLFTTWSHRWYDGWPLLGELPPHGRPYSQRWGDGAELSERELDGIEAAFRAGAVPGGLRLEAGDVLFVDNLRFSHGRAPYRGKRVVAAALGEPLDRSMVSL